MIHTRTYENLGEENLREMKFYAEKELKRFLEMLNGKYEPYRNKLIAICLCQGAAQHYLDCLINRIDKTGIKDIDIWFFFYEIEGLMVPYRALKFEIHTFKNIGEKGVDFLKRSMPRHVIEQASSEPVLKALSSTICLKRTIGQIIL